MRDKSVHAFVFLPTVYHGTVQYPPEDGRQTQTVEALEFTGGVSVHLECVVYDMREGHVRRT